MIINTITKDIRAVFKSDPAARTMVEVLLCYPGLHALIIHRAAHWCWQRRLKLFGRWMSHVARFLTGIEIHPGASIGEGFFIDHGMGVVIGETAVIGNNVTLYQGVTLGGTTHSKGKRHPTIEDNVVVGAGAKVLGPFTVGTGSMVGAGSVVISVVPPNSTIVGVPGRVSAKKGSKDPLGDLDHDRLPDPVARALQSLTREVKRLKREVEDLKKGDGEVEAAPKTGAGRKKTGSSRPA